MKEKEVERTISKFEKIIGPVARRIANDVANKMKILNDKISPRNLKEYKKFCAAIEREYGRIIGAALARRLMQEK